MTLSAARALQVIHSELLRSLHLHCFDPLTRTKTRLFSFGSPQGKQFALIIGDLDPVTKQPKAGEAIVVLPPNPVPNIGGVVAKNRPYKTQRLKQADSKLHAPDNRGYLVTDEVALSALLRWYAAA